MDVFDRVYAALKGPVETLTDTTLTCAGKKGHGNRYLRVHYRQAHLVVKCTLRDDLEKNPEACDQYLTHLEQDAQYPWLVLQDQKFVDLKTIPGVVQIKADDHLTASMTVGQVLWDVLAEIPRENAYMRKWSAANSGIGVELILLAAEDGIRKVYEFSVNYYAKPELEKLTETLGTKLARMAS